MDFAGLAAESRGSDAMVHESEVPNHARRKMQDERLRDLFLTVSVIAAQIRNITAICELGDNVMQRIRRGLEVAEVVYHSQHARVLAQLIEHESFVRPDGEFATTQSAVDLLDDEKLTVETSADEEEGVPVRPVQLAD